MGLGERSLEAKRRHGAAPDRGWLPAPAPPRPLRPSRAEGPRCAPPRPAPARTARAPPARCLPDLEPVRAGSAGCDSRGEPEAAGGEGTVDALAGKDADADLPGGQLQRSRIGAYWGRPAGTPLPSPTTLVPHLDPAGHSSAPVPTGSARKAFFSLLVPLCRALAPPQPPGQEGGEEGAAPPPAG